MDSKVAADLLRRINGQTLGQLLRNSKRHTDAFYELEPLLARALEERNQLAHSFYRQHNLRRNSDAGRAIMLQDLEYIHATLLAAWKAVNVLQGIDLDALVHETKTNESANHGGDGALVHLPI